MSRALISFVFIFLKCFEFVHSLDLSCDFDTPFNNGVCNYRPFGNSRPGTWLTVNQHEARRSPALDGPLNPVPGSFLQLRHSKGQLRTDPVFLNGSYCLSLDYYLISPRPVNIGIFAQKTTPNSDRSVTTLFFRNHISSRIDNWQQFKQTINLRPEEYEIQIVASEQNHTNAVAIDNLRFVEGACPDLVTDVRTCDFDGIQYESPGATHDLNCDWLVSSNQERPWHVMQPRNQLFDFSTGSNHGGMLISYDGPLYFDITPAEGRHCFSFYTQYHNDDHHWTLTERSIESGVENILWTSSLDDNTLPQSNMWRYKQFNIDPVVPLRIELVSTEARLVIDSIRLSKGSCSRPRDCSFKDGFCGWTSNMPIRSDAWLIGHGRVVYPDRHLVDEFGLRNEVEQFAYVDLSGSRSTATLESDLINTGTYCVRFEYSTNRPVGFWLKVIALIPLTMRDIIEGGLEPTNNEWRDRIAEIKTVHDFRIMISVAARSRTMFKLRNLKFHEGTCAEYHSGRNSSGTSVFRDVNFHCYKTGHYVPQYRTCDGVIDCPMGEDEDEHCQTHNCEQSGFMCNNRRHKFCVREELLCNGVADCDDSSDEDPRLCDKDQFCSNFCVNDGDCSREPNLFSCACRGGTSGKRCHVI